MSFVGGMCYHGEVAERRKQHGLFLSMTFIILGQMSPAQRPMCVWVLLESGQMSIVDGDRIEKMKEENTWNAWKYTDAVAWRLYMRR